MFGCHVGEISSFGFHSSNSAQMAELMKDSRGTLSEVESHAQAFPHDSGVARLLMRDGNYLSMGATFAHPSRLSCLSYLAPQLSRRSTSLQ